MADIRKKVFLSFFERLKLLDCSCVRSLLGISYNYRNGIGGILNVSFCSLCSFVHNLIRVQKVCVMVKVQKIMF
jgi:hypothetical protein